MESDEAKRQRMDIMQARLNLDNDFRMVLHSQRGTVLGLSILGHPQSQLGGNGAIHSLPQNTFALQSHQAGLGPAFHSQMGMHNGYLGMPFQGIPRQSAFPLGQDSSPLIVMNASDLSRLMNPVVPSPSPIIILPAASLQLQGQQFAGVHPPQFAGMHPPQFAMPRDRFVHQQGIFLPGGVSQMNTANTAGGERIIFEESKSALLAERQQQGQAVSRSGMMARNPLDLLASASTIPNSTQATRPTATAMANTASVVPPSTTAESSDNPKPKRPLSAYNIFFRDERAKIIAGELSDEERDMLQRGHLFEDQHTSSGVKESRRKQPHRKAGFQELARIIAARWKKIDPNHLQMYEKMSALGRIKYSRDLQVWGQREKKDVMKPIQRIMEKVAAGTRER